LCRVPLLLDKNPHLRT